MKNILSKLMWVIILFFCLALMLFALGVEFYEILGYCVNFIKIVGKGSLIIGIVILPLSIYGAIQIFRGFCALCDQDKISSHWNFILTIISILTLLFAILQF